MILVSCGHRPLFDLFIGVEVVPRLSSIVVAESPACGIRLRVLDVFEILTRSSTFSGGHVEEYLVSSKIYSSLTICTEWPEQGRPTMNIEED